MTPTTEPGTSNSSEIDFGGLSIRFDARVLEPRLWTLAQAAWAAELAGTVPPGPVLELCAGAGHIGLAAVRQSGRALVQVDVDPVACGYARLNATNAGLGERVEVRCGPMDLALREEELFELVLADPPYLSTAQTARYPLDPLSAIDGGRTGFDLIATCLTVTGHHLSPTGTAVLQVSGPDQADEVARHLEVHPELGLRQLEVRDCGRGALVRLGPSASS